MTTYRGVRLVLSIIGVTLIVQNCYGDGKSGKTGEEPVAVHVDKHKSCPNCYIPPWLRRKTKATTTTTTTTTTTRAPHIIHVSTLETTKRVIKVKQKKNRKSKLARNQSKVEAVTTARSVVVLGSSTPRSQVDVQDSDTLNYLINSVLDELLKEDLSVSKTKTLADTNFSSPHALIADEHEHSPVVGNVDHSTGGLNFHSSNHDLHNSYFNFVGLHSETIPDSEFNKRAIEYESSTAATIKPAKKKKKSKSRKPKIPTTQEVPVEREANTIATNSKAEEETIFVTSSSINSTNPVQSKLHPTQQVIVNPDPIVDTSNSPVTLFPSEILRETTAIREETSELEKRHEDWETTPPALFPPTDTSTSRIKIVISTTIADESTKVDQTTLQSLRTAATPIFPEMPPETTTIPEQTSVPEKRDEDEETTSPATLSPAESPEPPSKVTFSETFPPADLSTPPLRITPPATFPPEESLTPLLGIHYPATFPLEDSPATPSRITLSATFPPTDLPTTILNITSPILLPADTPSPPFRITPRATFPPTDSPTPPVKVVIPTTTANESSKVDQTTLRSWTTTESLVEFSEGPSPIPIFTPDQSKTTVTTTPQPIRIIFGSSSIPKIRKLKQIKVRKPKAPRPVQPPKPVRRLYQLEYPEDIKTTPKYTPPPSPSPTPKVLPARRLQRVRQKKSRTTPRHHHRPTFPVIYHPTLPHIRNRHQSPSTSTHSTIELVEFHVYPPTAPSVHGHLLNTDDIDYIIDEYPSDNPDVHSNAIHLKGSFKSQNFPMSDTHIFFHDQFE